MDYDDLFETLDELLTTINGTVQDRVDLDNSDTAGPYFSYMFDKDDGVFDDMDTIVFPLSPMH